MGKVKKFTDKLWYGTGAIGLDLSYGMFYSFLNKYLTDVLKLKANFLLILTPLARIWDGVNDPMMGTIVDNTHTRMGKYRPWILRGALMNAVVLALLFNNPGIPTAGVWIYIYIAVLYIGWGMTNTLADGAVADRHRGPHLLGPGAGRYHHRRAAADEIRKRNLLERREGVGREKLFGDLADRRGGPRLFRRDQRAENQRDRGYRAQRKILVQKDREHREIERPAARVHAVRHDLERGLLYDIGRGRIFL